MAANFLWGEANGAGQTLTSGIVNVNWKNVDDNTTAYSSSPITAGNNSFGKWQYGIMYGTFNQILNGKWSHTAGSFASNLTLWGAPVGSSQLTFATPSTTLKETSTVLTNDMTATTAIGSGLAVYFGGTSANTAGKATSSTSNPTYTNYLATQLATTVGAAAGDTTSVTITLQYDEN